MLHPPVNCSMTKSGYESGNRRSSPDEAEYPLISSLRLWGNRDLLR
jgi:hypothetical protein